MGCRGDFFRKSNLPLRYKKKCVICFCDVKPLQYKLFFCLFVQKNAPSNDANPWAYGQLTANVHLLDSLYQMPTGD